MKTQLKLRLYVSGNSRLSREAQVNLTAACDAPEVRDYYDIDIDVIDITKSPNLAEEDKVLMTPVLIKQHPSPPLRIVGDVLALQSDILAMLDIRQP